MILSLKETIKVGIQESTYLFNQKKEFFLYILHISHLLKISFNEKFLLLKKYWKSLLYLIITMQNRFFINKFKTRFFFCLWSRLCVCVRVRMHVHSHTHTSSCVTNKPENHSFVDRCIDLETMTIIISLILPHLKLL